MHQLVVGDRLNVGLADRVVHADEAADFRQWHLLGHALRAVGIVHRGDVLPGLRVGRRRIDLLLRMGLAGQEQCKDEGDRAKTHQALHQDG